MPNVQTPEHMPNEHMPNKHMPNEQTPNEHMPNADDTRTNAERGWVGGMLWSHRGKRL